MFEASVRVVCACELVRVHALVGRRWVIKEEMREGGFYRRGWRGGENCRGFMICRRAGSCPAIFIDLIYFLLLSSPKERNI